MEVPLILRNAAAAATAAASMPTNSISARSYGVLVLEITASTSPDLGIGDCWVAQTTRVSGVKHSGTAVWWTMPRAATASAPSSIKPAVMSSTLRKPTRVRLQPPGVETPVVLIDEGPRRDELVDRIQRSRRSNRTSAPASRSVELLRRPRPDDRRGHPGCASANAMAMWVIVTPASAASLASSSTRSSFRWYLRPRLVELPAHPTTADALPPAPPASGRTPRDGTGREPPSAERAPDEHAHP